MDKFLKRFTRLENNTTLDKDFLPGSELQKSKRFSKLEINDNKIEFVIEDKVAPQEKVAPGKEYFFLCPYCGGQNNANLDVCSYCKRQLRNQYIPDYSGKSELLKKCHCGAINLKERKNCWVCGRDFSLWGDEAVKEAPENVITLNIDGKTYQSIDQDLPPGIVALMEKIRREGYSKELIDQWLQERNEEVDLKLNETETRIQNLRWDVGWRVLGIILIISLVFLRTWCYHSYHPY